MFNYFYKTKTYKSVLVFVCEFVVLCGVVGGVSLTRWAESQKENPPEDTLCTAGANWNPPVELTVGAIDWSSSSS